MVNKMILIDQINQLAENNELYFLCGLVKECLSLLKDNLDKLHPLAKQVVENYLQ